jgi:magnesium chelatase family protein
MAAFRERLSGPILDRIDLRVQVARPTRFELFHAPDGEPSTVARERVVRAREAQRERLSGLGIGCNAEIPSRSLEEACRMTAEATATLEDSVDSYALTARGAHRTIRVARTVADLRGADAVTAGDVNEALSYRLLDGE